MPKQTWKIEEFHGGLNSNADPRDIKDVELSSAVDVMVDEGGKVRTMGGTTSAHRDHHNSLFPTPGRGLAALSHDPIISIGGQVEDWEHDHDGIWRNVYRIGNHFFTHGNSPLEYIPIDENSNGRGLEVKVEIGAGFPAYRRPNSYEVYETRTIGNQVWTTENVDAEWNFRTGERNRDLLTYPVGYGDWGDWATTTEKARTLPRHLVSGGDIVWHSTTFIGDDVTSCECQLNDDLNDCCIGGDWTQCSGQFCCCGVHCCAGVYGYLYNWYVAQDPDNIAPGWHVPSDEEWKEWEMSLGMSQEEADGVEGDRGVAADIGCKAARYIPFPYQHSWATMAHDYPDYITTLDAGGYRGMLGAVPAGFAAIQNGGDWSGQHYYALFWSSTEFVRPDLTSPDAWSRSMAWSNRGFGRAKNRKNVGASLRWVMHGGQIGGFLEITIEGRGVGYQVGDKIVIPGYAYTSMDEGESTVILWTDGYEEGEEIINEQDLDITLTVTKVNVDYSQSAADYLVLASTYKDEEGQRPNFGLIHLYEEKTGHDSEWNPPFLQAGWMPEGELVEIFPLYMGPLTVDEVAGFKTFEPVMYLVDGSLKICDGNFENNNISKVFESVCTKSIRNLVVNDKFAFSQELTRPIVGTFSIDEHHNPPSFENMVRFVIPIHPHGDHFFNDDGVPIDDGEITIGIEGGLPDSGLWEVFSLDEETREVEIPRGIYDLYATYSYRDNQESNVVRITRDAFNGQNYGSKISQIVSVKIYSTSNLVSKRIRAVNFYYSIADDEDNLYFLVSADLEKGLQQHDGSTKVWNFQNDNYIDSKIEIGSPSVITFEARNGFLPRETIRARYKTAVVANRRVYVGNIYQNNRVYGDRMIKSPVNKFDTFPESNYMDVSVQDGDDIVKLEVYADRILQFKKNKMHLINISQETEFLEDTFMYKGISHPAATCKTDDGIAWVNKHGVYLYDGKDVKNLLEKNDRQIIKESEWSNFLTSNKDGTGEKLIPMIGYYPKKRQLIVFDDIAGTIQENFPIHGAFPKMYLYDVVTQSWSTGSHDDTDRYIHALKTNMTTDWNGDLIYVHSSGEVEKWDDTSKGTETLSLTTKDIDFKEPSQKKRVYKVLVTYKSDGVSNVRAEYAVNGVIGIDDWTALSTGLADTSNEWSTVKLNVIPTDIYSFTLRFRSVGDTPESFEIDDISITYRLKGIR